MADKVVVGVGSELSEEEKRLLDSGHSFMEVDSRYSSFKVVPKEDEVNDSNFPPNAAAAMQLFVMAGLPNNASTCKKCVDAQIAILEKGPDGKTQHRLGTGAICWECGYAGLARNNDAFDAGRPKEKGTKAVCNACGSDEQTNVINAVNEDGKTRLPWIEVHSENSADQEKAARSAAEAEKSAGNAGSENVEGAQGGGEQGALGVKSPNVGRNDPCPCGSGKKSKKCCS
jgi:hypothetical protein